ncbi:uncharacterized protein LOC115371027 [Myripristis murdjan]|uniref:uncharacterized protein LOC115371027 n=1 Tax=Myripristis murdjan TaxID=586833 RepID=UPI0011763AB5|nr:uncharacterized protein LOC115371027 [Myripristis murdjan]
MAWLALEADPWVVSTMTHGYRIQFLRRPPVTRTPLFTTVADPHQGAALQAELSTLLEKGAIREVASGDQRAGFFSRYFLAPKRDGGLRPILDLRGLNQYLRPLRCRILTVPRVRQAISAGDWFATIDLKDAYFQIPIWRGHWRFLRFGFASKIYEFQVLPFGISLAPRTFTRCMDVVLSPLRHKGIRILNYLDDWVVCVASEEQCRQHVALLLDHVRSLGLLLNYKKSRLEPAQVTSFLGMVLDSRSGTVALTQERQLAFRSCVALFQLRALVNWGLCLRLMGLMAAMTQVVPLALLHMRPVQRCLLSLCLCPQRSHKTKVLVSRRLHRALRWWKVPANIGAGRILGPVTYRQLVYTDASPIGWGAVHEGWGANGVWTGRWQGQHINVLELRAALLALRHVLPRLRGHHVIVRTDSTVAAAYINRQGGLGSPVLCKLATVLWQWAHPLFLSLRAMHVPGVLNSAADIMSRGGPQPGEWRLHPEVVSEIWRHFGRAEVDLFASRESSHCQLFFSLRNDDPPLGWDALAHPWPRVLLYAFPPFALLQPLLRRVQVEHVRVILVAPLWPHMAWFSAIPPLLDRPPWELPRRRDLLSQANGALFHPFPAGLRLVAWPLRGAAYSYRWLFAAWCGSNQVDPYLASPQQILQFLQSQLEARKAAVTLRGLVAAIKAVRIGEVALCAEDCALISRFLQGAHRLTVRTAGPAVPPWDLDVVLGALQSPPFEPLRGADLKWLSIKTAFLLAITSARRVSELHALSVHGDCCRFSSDGSSVVLRPNPAFLPKVLTEFHLSQSVELRSLSPPDDGEDAEQGQSTLCPVRALTEYIRRTQAIRRSNQLFVCHNPGRLGRPLSKSRLSHWVVDAIRQAYVLSNVPIPSGVRAHSTRGVAASWTLWRGASLASICSAATWSSPSTFTRFYRLNVAASPSLGERVLGSARR